MGTRNLTLVQYENKYKIAQYGQWDGYPSGQGLTILNFLKSADLDIFKQKLNNVRFHTEEDDAEINSFLKSIGVKDGWMNLDQSAQYTKIYPHLSRDVAAKILEIVYNSEKQLSLTDSSDFANDSLFCEWAYVIDLDDDKLEVYEGFNKNPLSDKDRFYQKGGKYEKYYPIKLKVVFDLNNLPSEKEFLDIDKSEEE